MGVLYLTLYLNSTGQGKQWTLHTPDDCGYAVHNALLVDSLSFWRCLTNVEFCHETKISGQFF